MRIVVGIFMAIIVSLVAGFVPIMEAPYTVTVQYQDTETYYENEPYEAMETYYETESLSYEVHFSQNVEQWVQGDDPFGFITNRPTGYVNVKNTDKIQGVFKVEITFYYGDRSYTRESPLELRPGQVKTAEMTSDDIPKDFVYKDGSRGARDFWESFWAGDWGIDYQVIPDTKAVEKERTITKYRQLEKERTVAKQHPETRHKKVPLLDYWLHY